MCVEDPFSQIQSHIVMVISLQGKDLVYNCSKFLVKFLFWDMKPYKCYMVMTVCCTVLILLRFCFYATFFFVDYIVQKEIQLILQKYFCTNLIFHVHVYLHKLLQNHNSLISIPHACFKMKS